MKTAEEWMQAVNITAVTGKRYPVTQEQIKQIQFDAMKEGMRRASAVARHAGSYANEHAGCDAAANAILSAAEQLTISDL